MALQELKHVDITGAVLTAFYKVYNELGYGFVEARYSAALEHELRNAGRHVAREYATRVYYKGVEVGFHRLDMVIDLVVAVEIKSTPILLPYARRQLQNYLKATNLEVGMLLHFGPKPGFERLYFPNDPNNKPVKPNGGPYREQEFIDDLIEFERRMDEEAREEDPQPDDELDDPDEFDLPWDDTDPPPAVPV